MRDTDWYHFLLSIVKLLEAVLALQFRLFGKHYTLLDI